MPRSGPGGTQFLVGHYTAMASKVAPFEEKNIQKVLAPIICPKKTGFGQGQQTPEGGT